jgi:hypothetical protein
MRGLATLFVGAPPSEATGMLFRKHIEELDRMAVGVNGHLDKLETERRLQWDIPVTPVAPRMADFDKELPQQRAEISGPRAG